MRAKPVGAVAKAVIGMLLILTLTQPVLARPSVGVVLGGGAARGFSHIGLLRAFEEEGVPVDFLVGASMGSIVAGLYAAGLSPDQLAWMVQEIEISELFAPRVPLRGGVLDTGPFEEFLEELTDGILVEELETPFYSVITHLVTGETIALDHGPLSRAIVASMSIPGMFPPVEIDGGMYVDGGIKEPVPAAAARRLGADVVIAVDIRRQLDEIDHDAIITNLQLTLYFLLDHNTEMQLEHADIVITPGVETASYMEYAQAASFIEEGYAAAKVAVPHIKALLKEKDPSISFVPRRVDGPGVDEAFRERVNRALAAAKSERKGGTIRSNAAFLVEQGRSARLDLELGLGLAGKADGQLVGTYGLSRRLAKGGERIHTLGLGFESDAFSGGVFWRKEPFDSKFFPGARARLRWGGETGGRILVGGQWHAEGTTPGVEVDVGGEWVFAGKRRGLWEIATLEPAPYVGVGVRKNLSDAASPYRFRAEAGFDFKARLFGIYPLHSRISLVYRGGDSPWALAITLGE